MSHYHRHLRLTLARVNWGLPALEPPAPAALERAQRLIKICKYTGSRLVQSLSLFPSFLLSFLSSFPSSRWAVSRQPRALPRARRNVYDQGEIKSTAKISSLIRVCVRPLPNRFFFFPPLFVHRARVNTRKRLHWIRSEREHLTDGSLKGLWNRLTLLQRSPICLVYSAFTASVYARPVISCQRNSWGIWFDDSPCRFSWTFRFCWNCVLVLFLW